jgi:hypothetical protein
MSCAVLCELVGGKNGPTKSWMEILAETLASLLLGIDYHFGTTKPKRSRQCIE